MDGTITQIDYSQNKYHIDQLLLKDSWINLDIGKASSNTGDTTSVSENDYAVSTDWLLMKNVAFDFNLPDQLISGHIMRLENKESFFRMIGSDIKISTPFMEVEDSQFRYDIPSAARRKGFDPNHLAWQNMQIAISDFQYDNPGIKANITKLSAKDANGFELLKGQSTVDFSKNGIVLENLIIKTNQSDIQSAKTNIQYPFFEYSKYTFYTIKIENRFKLTDKKHFRHPLLLSRNR